MNPLSLRTQLTVFVALSVPAALSVLLMFVPALMTMSTYAAIAVLIIGVAAVTLHTAHNARPTGSLAQLLYETEGSGAARDPFSRR